MSFALGLCFLVLLNPQVCVLSCLKGLRELACKGKGVVA